MSTNVYVHPTVVFNAAAQQKLESDTGLKIGLQGARLVLERPAHDLTQAQLDNIADKILADSYSQAMTQIMHETYGNGRHDIVYVPETK